jgi:hypothetical protein
MINLEESPTIEKYLCSSSPTKEDKSNEFTLRAEQKGKI